MAMGPRRLLGPWVVACACAFGGAGAVAAAGITRCSSGAVDILVGGASLQQAESPCRGFGTGSAPARSGHPAEVAATEHPVSADRVDPQVQRQRDSDRRLILETERGREQARLRELKARALPDSAPEVVRTQANLQALERELALLSRSAGP